ncbi:MAG TPA: isochorismatase family protein [Rhizomicrobium sp.]|nr:isochorismatase family protein [Rhizomicrobium sp.]
MLIRRGRSQLLLVDVQEKIAPAMTDRDGAEENMARLLNAARICNVPVTVVEHYPDGLGPTLHALMALSDVTPIAKTTFSAAACADVRDAVMAHAAEGRVQLIVMGLEAHVCVLQSALEFQVLGLETFVVADAVASRTAKSVDIALRRLEAGRVTLCTTEMAMFEWIGDANAHEFRAMRSLLR